MKIQMIAPTPFFAHRGCHVRILEEIRSLQARGHEVALCTYGLGEDVPGVRAARTWRVPWYRKLTAGPSWHKLYLDVLLLATAIRLARRFRPDVIHAHLHEGVFLGALVARLFRIPLLGDFQGSMTTEMADHGFFSGWPWGERLFVRLEGWINRAPRRIVVSSRAAVAQIAPSRGSRADTVTVLPDGVDAGAFRPDDGRRAAIRARLGIEDGAPLIAYLGLLTEYQGADLLLEAAPQVLRRIPRARFLVMGFPNEDRYRQRAAERGLSDQMTFTGRIRYEDAPTYLAAADIAVSPKISVTEANGKLLNYMALGLPTVVFETAVNREILADCAAFARLGDAGDLAAKLVELVEDAPRRRDLGGRARARAIEEFSWETQARRFEEVYQDLLDGVRAQPSARRSTAA